MQHPTDHGHSGHAEKGHYTHLAIELAIDFVIMYFVMYAMIATLQHFHFNLNNLYMTLMMVTPMALIMLFTMRSMFPNSGMNVVIAAAAAVIFFGSFYGIRAQVGVGNADFLRSMIPHHSGAVLMCRSARITDPEIISLCRNIMDSQQREIDQMERILARL